jgi:poly(A) polymerase
LRIFVRPEALSLLSRISKYLSKQNIKAYLVGGFVRDALLKRDTSDIDIAIAANPMETGSDMASELGGTYIPLDRVNRIARIALRSTEGKKWNIDLSEISGDIEGNLAKRDFSINAIAVPLGEATGQAAVEVIDPYEGLTDLEQKVIRAVAPDIFELDSVRLLRAVRLAAELGFKIDTQTEEWLMKSTHLITHVAAERTREELLRLLLIPGTGHFVRYMHTTGLVTAIFPEMIPARGVEQPVEHHWDVFDHSLETMCVVDFVLGEADWKHVDYPVRESLAWSTSLKDHFGKEIGHGSTRGSLLKLAALLHDVAKPGKKTVEEGSRVRFLGHPEEGAGITARILERLRFSNKEINFMSNVVRYHMRPRQMSSGGLPTHRAVYRFFRDTEGTGIDVLFLSLADHLASRGPDLDYEEWLRHVGEVEHTISEHFRVEQTAGPTRLIDGHDLIDLYGMHPGPEIGRILEQIHEAHASGELSTRDEALSYIRELLLTKGSNQA